MTAGARALAWLDALPSLAGFQTSTGTVVGVVDALDAVLAELPPTTSENLRAVRRRLAVRGYADIDGHDSPLPPSTRAATQLAVQFVCGYYDLDLRDATGLGHGHLIDEHGTAAQRAVWLPRLREGALIGIAASEAHGGTQFRRIATSARHASGGRQVLVGEKRWISRLHEAAAFVVFHRADRGAVRAAIIDADASGLHRTTMQPSGLAGWSWGVLRFDRVEIPAGGVLGDPTSDGAAMFARHFDRYRPVVAACALGAAAAVLDHAITVLRDRVSDGRIRTPRDSALELLGRSRVELTSALLSVFAAAAGVHRDGPGGSAAARAAKAHAVNIAYATVTALTPLFGAAAFDRTHPVAKAARDLAGFRLADGVHDALYRSVGKVLVGV